MADSFFMFTEALGTQSGICAMWTVAYTIDYQTPGRLSRRVPAPQQEVLVSRAPKPSHWRQYAVFSAALVQVTNKDVSPSVALKSAQL